MNDLEESFSGINTLGLHRLLGWVLHAAKTNKAVAAELRAFLNAAGNQDGFDPQSPPATKADLARLQDTLAEHSRMLGRIIRPAS